MTEQELFYLFCGLFIGFGLALELVAYINKRQ